jgi:ABC-2 type transport system permease protein
VSDAVLSLPRTGSAGRSRAALASVPVMTGQCVRLSRRTVDALLTSLMLPVLLMLLFVYLFGGAISTGMRYVTYVVPGVLLLCAGFGAASTAVSVCQDMTGGIIDRFRSLDVPAPAFLAGHVAASVARNTVSTMLVLGVALLIGFRPHAGPAGWLAAAAILLSFILAISWLAATAGLVARSAEAANGLAFGVMFLPYPAAPSCPSTPCLAGCAVSRRTSPSPRSLTPCAAFCSAPRSGPARGVRSPGAAASCSPPRPPPAWPSATGPHDQRLR